MSPKLKRMSGEDAIDVFRGLGFGIAGQSGSHVKLVRVTSEGERQVLTIPIHKILDIGTLHAIIRQASKFVDRQTLKMHFYTS